MHLTLAGTTLNDDQLKRLASNLPDLMSLNLHSTRVTDKGLGVQAELFGAKDPLKFARILCHMIWFPAFGTVGSLRYRYVCNPAGCLSRLTNLTSLNLKTPNIENISTGLLSILPKLEKLTIKHQQMRNVSMAQLSAYLPDCNIQMS